MQRESIAKMTIVETCHDSITQVYVFTFEQRVVSAVLTKYVLFALVGNEPVLGGDLCCSGFFICSFLFFVLPVRDRRPSTVGVPFPYDVYVTTVIIHASGIF